MLVRFNPDNINEFWDIIAYSIEASLGFSEQVYMTELLTSIMEGTLDVWISYGDEKVNYIVTGYLMINPIDKVKSYVIFSMTAFGKNDPEGITEELEVLKDHAKSIGCAFIQGFTGHTNVLRLAHKLGFKSNNNLIMRL